MSYAILTLGKEGDVPPDHSRGGPVHVSNPSESVVKCADLRGIVRGKGGTNSVSIRAISDHRAPKGGGGVLGLEISTPHPAEAGSREAESSVFMTMSGLEKGVWPIGSLAERYTPKLFCAI